MAVVIVASYRRTLGLPYALSWWAYTFPLGALAVSSGVVWQVTGFESVHWFYIGVVVALFFVWVTVATQTAIAANVRGARRAETRSHRPRMSTMFFRA